MAHNIWMKFLGKLKVQSASDELWCSVKFKYGLFVFYLEPKTEIQKIPLFSNLNYIISTQQKSII